MLAQLQSLTLIGLEAEMVEIEVDIHQGMPSFQIVGLGDTSIQESKERIRSAIKNSGYAFPRGKIAVNLAPADLRKHGPRFDTAIAIGILAALGQLGEEVDFEGKAFLGELAFSGELRGLPGVLPTVSGARNFGVQEIFVPEINAEEASLIPHIKVYPVSSLKALVEHLTGFMKIEPLPTKKLDLSHLTEETEDDFRFIKGNEYAKRALEIAAAGGHNLLMSGPPGSGKTMLSKSFATILPKLSIEEALEITKIHSIAGSLNSKSPVMFHRPFRTVHHTASGVAIVGGGNPPTPGEISLAHRGVLFLDEFAEFPQKTLEVLRQPLEDGNIAISRVSGTLVFPAKFILVAAMNPCPCGYLSDLDKDCVCSPFQVQRYKSKISGPLLDRIDLHLEVPRLNFEKLSQLEEGDTSEMIRKRVQAARDIQQKRFNDDENTRSNAEMSSSLVKKYCRLDSESQAFMKTIMSQMNLSGRAFYRVLKLARTIADLEGSESIAMGHIAEAVQYRSGKSEF